MHYTGPAADELDLLLGGRTTSNEVGSHHIFVSFAL